jgi:uncharacterized protein YhjY with autotransporter beta-barrel domain
MYSGQYTVNGSTVTGSGTSNSAYFTGATGTGYDVTVQSGANLSSSSGTNAIQLDNGTVTVQSGATVAGTSANSVYFSGTNGTGTLNNAGTLNGSGTDNYNVALQGTSVVNNTGTIGGAGWAGIYIQGNGVVNNTGTILESGVIGVNIVGNANISNSGTVYEGYYGGAIDTGFSIGNPRTGSDGAVTVFNTTTGILTSGMGGNCNGSGIQVYSNHSVATLTNAGTITSTAACFSEGIGLYGAGSGSILNSGTIYGNNTGGSYIIEGIGIDSSDSNISITNNGTITLVGTGGGGEGIIVSGSNAITINNSNLINVSVTGTDDYGVFIDGTSSNVTITNTGTIEASGGSTISSGVYGANESSEVSVTNSGSISGSTYGVYLGGDHSSLLTTTGGVITGGTDAIALAGTNDTVAIGGQSHISGTIEGDVANHGTPLSGNSLTFYLSGLNASQIAAFNSEIATAGTGAGTYTVGGDTYSWDSFGNVILAPVGNNLQPVVDGGLGGIAGRLANMPFNASYTALYSAAATNPQAALNSFTGREVINAYRSQNTGNAIALSQLTGNRSFDTRSGSSQVAGDPILVADLWNASVMTDAGGGLIMQKIPSLWSAWFTEGVTYANAGTTAPSPGYRSTINSPAGGIDYRLTPETTVGALFRYQSAETYFEDGSRSGLTSVLIGTDDSWSQDHWFVNGSLAGGFGIYDNQRVTLGGAGAISKPASSEIFGDISGGYDFTASDNARLSPIVGLQYNRIAINSYNERGAGAYDISQGSQIINGLQSKVGVNLSNDFMWQGIAFTPKAQAAWYHELLNQSQNVTESIGSAAQLSGFGAQAAKADRDYGMFGIGVNMKPTQLPQDMSLFVNYDTQVGLDYIARTVWGGVKVAF